MEESAIEATKPECEPSKNDIVNDGRIRERSGTRGDTPGPIPQNAYTKDELLDLENAAVAKLKPKYLLKEHFNNDGKWDPEKWFRSFGGSRGSSPMTVADRRRRPPLDLDRDVGIKRRPSEPCERIRRESESNDIVLSPQRRSFGTGCHVSQQRNSPVDITRDKEEPKRVERRVGSGRVSIDHERSNDYRNQRDHYERDDGRFDRNHRGNDRDNRGFRDRDNRDRDNRDRDNRDRDNRGYYQERPDRRYNNTGRSGYYGDRYQANEEPEWFSSGPVDRYDTIELHGFEKSHDTSNTQQSKNKKKEMKIAEVELKKLIPWGQDIEPEKEVVVETRVQDKNGSLETNESSSQEGSVDHEQTTSTHNHDFDISEILKLSNIPGLTDEAEREVETQSSRFSRWFQSGQPSQGDSKRSSISEDNFGYLNDLVSGGQKSPIIPSPTPDQDYHKANILALIKGASTPQAQASAQKMEADLKAMLMGGSKSSAVHEMSSLPGGIPGKVMTAVELEADLKRMIRSQPEEQRQQRAPSPQPGPYERDDMAAFNKLVGLMKVNGSLPNEPKMISLNDKIRMEQEQAARNEAVQKAQMQELLIQQQQQQLNVAQQIAMQQMQQQQHVQQLQHQQNMTLQQKLQQRVREQDAILNFVKNNPAIVTKPASPQLTNALANHVLQQAIIQQSTPKAQSPVMFGSQPPANAHLRAPSPIHPGQQSPGLQTSPTLGRVPSPQELAAHTQAIMQNALIKKQLEQQKERYNKRQKDSIPLNLSTSGTQMPHTPTTNKASSFSTAFTPTSVIRKMASDKADRNTSLVDQELSFLNGSDVMNSHGVILENKPRPLVGQSQLSPRTQQQQGRPIVKGQGHPMSVGNSNLVNYPQSLPRPIVGGGGLANQVDVQKLIELQLRQQHQGNASPVTVQQQRHIPQPMLPGMPTTPLGNSQMMALQRLISPLALQQQQQASLGMPPQQNVGQFQQLNPMVSQLMALQQAQQQQAQLAGLDPRIQAQLLASQQLGHNRQSSPQPAIPIPMIPGNIPDNISGLMNLSQQDRPQMNLSQHDRSQMNMSQHERSQQMMMNLSQLEKPPPMTSSASSLSPRGDNLARWFGNDVLKQQHSSLPPLPSQGQAVLTLDEIERMQAVRN